MKHVIQAVEEELLKKSLVPARREVSQQRAAPAHVASDSLPIARINSLRGEFWLQDGSATYADGDIGDINHEGVVLDALAREVLDALGIDYGNDEYVGVDEYQDQIGEVIGDPDLGTEALTEALKDTWEDPEQLKAVIGTIFGQMDARDYGTRWYGWTRVHGNSVQVHNLSSAELKSIAEGVADAAGYEHELDQEVFEIEVLSTGRFYSGVPYQVLEDGDMKKLRDYLYSTR